LTLESNNKNVDTQEHKSIRARRDCESAKEWLSTERGLWNTNKIYTTTV